MALRTLPNIMVSGTPGTGKTTLCKKLAKKIDGLKVVDFGKEAITYDCRLERDEELDCWVIDEEKLADALTPRLEAGGNVVDYMHANIWEDTSVIDLVITMHTDNTVLYDRYTSRDYSQKKIQENIDCEIMDVIGAENREYYEGIDEDGERTISDEDLTTTLVDLTSDTDKDVKSNVKKLTSWIEKWQKHRDEQEGTDVPMLRRVSFDE